MNANSRRIKQPQMKKIKSTSNEKLAIIKSKKPQIKTLKRIQTNKCERILPKMCSQQENRFFWKQTWRNEICMVEVSIGSYKEETNLKVGKVSDKKNFNAHFLWMTLILSIKTFWLENVETIGGILSTIVES